MTTKPNKLKTIRQWDLKKIDNGDLKMYNIRLTGKENIAKFSKVKNKAGFMRYCIENFLNEQGELK